MSKQQDKKFMASFLGVIAFLVLFTVIIIVIARVLPDNDELTPAQLARIEERLKSPGQVSTPVPAAGAGQAASEPMSGEQVAAQVCNACHTGAIPNAPKIGDTAAWTSRGNLAQLTASAIKGKGAMPPRGGRPSLSESEIESAIKHMAGL